MIEKYGFTHLSAGDLIRAAAQDSTTEKGQYFNEVMSQGKLISTVRKKIPIPNKPCRINIILLHIGRYSWIIEECHL